MSATNQLQQNSDPGALYEDQYVQVTANFLGYDVGGLPVPASNFNAQLRFHKLGKRVTLDIVPTSANAGVGAITTFRSTFSTIPPVFLPITAKWAMVPYSTSLGVTGGCELEMRTDGSLYMWRFGVDFGSFVSILPCCVTYYLP